LRQNVAVIPAPEPVPEPAPARRRPAWAAWLLWPVLVVWAGFVFVRAQRELTADLVVRGPERAWHSPSEVDDGWLLDPRPGRLAVELRDRFRPAAEAPASDDPRAALTALGLAFAESRGVGDGLRPRVLLPASGALLLVGFYGRDPVVFDPARGVVRLHRGVIGEDVPALTLTDAVEAPW
jgi:hypothetical protein